MLVQAPGEKVTYRVKGNMALAFCIEDGSKRTNSKPFQLQNDPAETCQRHKSLQLSSQESRVQVVQQIARGRDFFSRNDFGNSASNPQTGISGGPYPNEQLNISHQHGFAYFCHRCGYCHGLGAQFPAACD